MITPQSSGYQGEGAFFNQRVLSSSAQQVFDAFAQPDILARWWGPNGFANSFEVFEFQPGGHWRFVMHGPNNTNHPNECVFLTLEALHTLVIDHVSQPRYVLTVNLAPHEGATTIRWVQKFEDSAVAERIQHIAEPANEQNLDRLESVLSEGKS